MSSINLPRRLGPVGATAATTVIALACAVALVGCESMSERERGTAQGGGVGAVAGAVIGGVTGGSAGRGAVIGGVVGAVAGNLWSKRMEDKRRALEQASAGTGVQVDRTADNRLKVNVPTDVSFDIGRADIKPQMRPILDELAKNMDANVRVNVVGHTDSTGGEALNDRLSLERADAVRSYLSVRGLAASRVGVQGRGEREPVADNNTETGRAANRRVEIFINEPAA